MLLWVVFQVRQSDITELKVLLGLARPAMAANLLGETQARE